MQTHRMQKYCNVFGRARLWPAVTPSWQKDETLIKPRSEGPWWDGEMEHCRCAAVPMLLKRDRTSHLTELTITELRCFPFYTHQKPTQYSCCVQMPKYGTLCGHSLPFVSSICKNTTLHHQTCYLCASYLGGDLERNDRLSWVKWGNPTFLYCLLSLSKLLSTESLL